jgi:RNA polymerase sigma-70 factor (ECF subfamily)
MGENRDGEAGTATVADMAILAKLCQEHHDRLLGFLDRRMDPRLKARIGAQDLLQEAFLVARRKWPKFRASGMTPYAWLYGIARDSLIEAWRRHLARGIEEEMPWPERSSEQMVRGLVGSLTSPSEAMARRELQGRVRQALDNLSPTDREILWMRHSDDLSHREVAAVLGISEAAAMQRYSRALRRVIRVWRDLFDRGGSVS